MGLNRILLSFYSTFNVLFLGFACSNFAVGYFTTATKLYSIFIGLIAAFNGVLVPHLNSLIGQGNIDEFKYKVSLSFSVVSTLAMPFMFFAFFLAPEIIRLVAGEGYEPAILPFRIVSLQIILVGFAQITENQILLSLKKFKEVLYCTLASTILSIIILVTMAHDYAEVASALAVALPHFVECILLFYYAKKSIFFSFPIKELGKNFLLSIPIGGMCVLSKTLFENYLFIIAFCSVLSATYYLGMQYFVIKNKFIVNQINSLLYEK